MLLLAKGVIGQLADLGELGRIEDDPIFIEHAHLLDARQRTDRVENRDERVGMAALHSDPDGVFEGARQDLRLGPGDLHRLFGLDAEHEVGRCAENHHEKETDGERHPEKKGAGEDPHLP